jgi:Predicted Zn-dependent protease (DUF2268)
MRAAQAGGKGACVDALGALCKWLRVVQRSSVLCLAGQYMQLQHRDSWPAANRRKFSQNVFRSRKVTVAEWTLHWLEAEGELEPWRRQIAAEIEATRDIVSRLVTPPRLDVLVQRLPGQVIPEIGMVGHAFRRSLLTLTLDPDNANFSGCLADGAVRRTVAHEVHHCLRHAGPGYGRSLGEALVSEGLAGQFVTRLFGTPPELWERAVEPATAVSLFPDADALASTSYNHVAWFFGSGGKYPRWLGYTLGYMIVGRWLEANADMDGPTLVNVAAADVLSAWSSG